MRTLWASLLKGGGFGILGDVLLADNAYGKKISGALLGPSFGTLDQWWDVYATARGGLQEGDLSKVADAKPKALKALVDITPFANLFYARAALNYIGLYQAQEALNPGYLRRMERRVERDTGRSFIVSPSEAVR
jgi:hypothetical protein